MIQRFVVPVWMELKDNKEVTVTAHLSFKPDEMIVRSIAYVHDDSEVDAVNFVYCDAVNSVIGMFFDEGIQSPQTRFSISQLQTDIRFRVMSSPTGGDSAAEGQLGLILEFVKYPPSKV